MHRQLLRGTLEKPQVKRHVSKGRHYTGTITTSDGTEIFYKDWGTGQPIVFSHGWPLSADDWDTQMMFFLLHGYRVVAHDRLVTADPRRPATGTTWTTTRTTSPP
jgi:pimeloyl-ACP methyl ester carboxylesterase